MEDNIISKLADEIMEKKAKILDDFARAYLASLASKDEKHFLKLKKDDFRRIELVETIISPLGRTYQFRLKKGRLPNIYKKK